MDRSAVRALLPQHKVDVLVCHCGPCLYCCCLRCFYCRRHGSNLLRQPAGPALCAGAPGCCTALSLHSLLVHLRCSSCASLRTTGFRHCLAALFSGMRGGSGGGCHGLNVIQGGGGGTWEGERLHLQLLLCQACIRCSSLGRGSFQTRCFQGCGGEASFPKKSASTQHGEGIRAQQ